MTRTTYFSTGTFTFLADLAANNNRDWFTTNKARYEDEVKQPALRMIRDFAEPLGVLSPYFQASPSSLFRIHRDTRFSSDKSPYKTHAGIHFRHVEAKDAHTPGYYFHLEPGSVFVGLGVWHPDPKTLQAIRDHIVAKPTAWKKAARAPAFRETFELDGDRLTRPPKGYDPNHPLIEDLKYKDFVAIRKLPQSFATQGDLTAELGRLWGAGTPFMRFLCEAVGAPFA